MLSDALAIAMGYRQSRRLSRIDSREMLLAHQQQALHGLRAALARSPFYRDFAARPFEEWPVISKREWMENFDAINTVGINRAEAEGVALQAERDRNFSTDLRGVTVGLSTGTSGARGIFLASKSERHRWAAAMLAKLLPRGLWRRERIALLLRADSRLYGTVATGSWMKFRFLDTTKPLDQLARQLVEFSPTVLVGPPSVLALLAAHHESVRKLSRIRLVVCGAEVLNELDRRKIAAAFQAPMAEIYQATEGFIGATCQQGRMHLNEEYLIVEKQWLDVAQRRFVPVLTDLYRHTQPVIRYRLNDVLTEAAEPCPCGAATTSIERIEGREDDVLWIRKQAGAGWTPVFPDAICRSLLAAAPELQEYEITQAREDEWCVQLFPAAAADVCERIRKQLAELARRANGEPPRVIIETAPLLSRKLSEKRRRVRRLWRLESESHA